MLKNLLLLIPTISTLAFGGFPLFASAKAGQYQISVTAPSDIANAVAEIHVGGKIKRISLGYLKAGQTKMVKFSSSRLPSRAPVTIASGNRPLTSPAVPVVSANVAPDPGCTVASSYMSALTVSPGSAILTGGTGELVVGVGPDTRAELKSLSLGLFKKDSVSQPITDPVILQALRVAPATLMFTGSASAATLYLIDKKGQLSRKVTFQQETVINLAAAYDRLGVKGAGDVLGIPKDTDVANRRVLELVTNLEETSGFTLLINPPSATRNMSVLAKRSPTGLFESVGDILPANFTVGYIQAGDKLHVFISEAPLTQGIVSRNLGKDSSLISRSHDAGHKVLSMGWLSVKNTPSKTLSGWRLINLALAQDEDFGFSGAGLMVETGEVTSAPIPPSWSGGGAPSGVPAAPSGGGPVTGAPSAGPGSATAAKKKEDSGFNIGINVGVIAEFAWGGKDGLKFKGVGLGPIDTGDRGGPPPTDLLGPLRPGTELKLGPGFTIQGEDGVSAVEKCFDGKFGRRGAPGAEDHNPIDSAIETGKSGQIETPTGRTPLERFRQPAIETPPSGGTSDDLRGGILDRLRGFFPY